MTRPFALALLLGWVLACSAQTPLDLTLDGRAVQVDVYRPSALPRGGAILSHGFTRSRATMAGHAQALAKAGVLAVAPDLPYTFDFRRNAQALTELVAQMRRGGEIGPPVPAVVLVGFSAGGLSSLLAAGAPGVVGYVGLDPFDRVSSDGSTALGRDAAPGIHTPALLLRAPPSRCNAQSAAAPWGQRLPQLVADEVIPEASHCDFESPSDWMCRLACGATDPARQARVRAALLQAVDRWLPAGLRAHQAGPGGHSGDEIPGGLGLEQHRFDAGLDLHAIGRLPAGLGAGGQAQQAAAHR